MEIGSFSAASPSSEAQVKVFNGARKQAEAVANTLIEGIEESGPRVAGQTGQQLNVTA